MSINYKYDVVHELNNGIRPNISKVDANGVIKINKEAVKNYRKELMEDIYRQGYIVIINLEEAISNVNQKLSKLIKPYWASTGYTKDENGNMVPNPPELIDPDASKREALQSKLSTLSSKLSSAKALDGELNFKKLVFDELSNINYSLDAANTIIASYTSEINEKINEALNKKDIYVKHAIEVMNEFEVTRNRYINRNTTRLKEVPLVRHKDIAYTTSTSILSSSTKNELNKKNTQTDSKGNMYLEYYKNDIYIIEVIMLVDLEELKKKLLNEQSNNPNLYIKKAEISKLTSVESFEQQMLTIDYKVKKDTMGFYKKTIQGHMIFFYDKKSEI